MTLDLDPDSLDSTRPPSSPRAGVRVGLAFLFAGFTMIVCCNRGFNADKTPSPRLESRQALGNDAKGTTLDPDPAGSTVRGDEMTATATPATATATPVVEPTEVIIDERLYEQGVRAP